MHMWVDVLEEIKHVLCAHVVLYYVQLHSYSLQKCRNSEYYIYIYIEKCQLDREA